MKAMISRIYRTNIDGWRTERSFLTLEMKFLFSRRDSSGSIKRSSRWIKSPLARYFSAVIRERIIEGTFPLYDRETCYAKLENATLFSVPPVLTSPMENGDSRRSMQKRRTSRLFIGVLAYSRRLSSVLRDSNRKRDELAESFIYFKNAAPGILEPMRRENKVLAG